MTNKTNRKQFAFNPDSTILPIEYNHNKFRLDARSSGIISEIKTPTVGLRLRTVSASVRSKQHSTLGACLRILSNFPISFRAVREKNQLENWHLFCSKYPAITIKIYILLPRLAGLSTTMIICQGFRWCRSVSVGGGWVWVGLQCHGGKPAILNRK